MKAVNRTDEIPIITDDLATDRSNHPTSPQSQTAGNVAPESDLVIRAMQSLDIPVYLIDVSNYHIVSFNDTARRLGIRSGIPCHQQTHHRNTPCTEDHPCPMVIAKSTKEPMQARHIHYDAKGNPRIIEVHGIPIFNDSGDVEYVAEYCIDLSEQCRVENALRITEERYRIVAEHTGQLIYDYDLKTGQIAWHGAIEMLTGYAPDDFGCTDSARWMEYIHPEDRERARQVHEAARHGLAPWQCEYRFRCADGTYKHLEDNGTSLNDDHGEIVRLLGVMQDVTYRIKAEQAQNNSRRYLQYIINTISDPIFVKDEQHHLLTANDALCTLIGQKREDVIGKSDEELYPPHQARIFIEHDNKVFSSMKEDENEESIDDASGSRYIISTKKAAFVDPISNEKVLVGVIRDITKWKQAEKALQISEKYYRSLFDNMSEGFAHCRVIYEEGTPIDFMYINVNGAFQKMTGLANAVGKRVTELIPGIRESNPELFEIYGRVAQTGKPEKFETYVGTLGIWFSVAVYSPEKEFFVSVFDNITERKLSEVALQRSEAKYRSLYDSTSDAMMLLGSNRFIDCNKAALEIYGCGSREEFCSKHPVDLSPPQQPCGTDSMTLAKEQIDTALEYGTNHFEWAHKRVDNGEIFLADVLLNAMELDGQPVLQAVVRDITTRKRMEEEIAYRLRVEAALATASRLIQVPNADNMNNLVKTLGKVIKVNRCYIFRLDNSGRDVSIIHEWCDSETPPLINHFQNLKTSRTPWVAGKLERDESVVIERLDDLPPEAEVDKATFRASKLGAMLLVPIFTASGRLAGSVGFEQMTDQRRWLPEDIRLLRVVGEMISAGWERQRADEILTQTVERYTAMINTVPALMFIKDFSHRYTVVNDALCAVAQKTDAEITGKTDAEILPAEPAEWLSSIGRSVIETGQSIINQEKHIDFGDGTTRWMAATVVPLIDHNDAMSGVVGIIQDITEERRSRDQLIQNDKLAAIGTLAAGVAHEINNPMGFISSNLNTMGKYLKKIEAFVAAPPAQQGGEKEKLAAILADFSDAIAESSEGAGRVKKIVADLKSFSRVDRAEKQLTNLNEGLESTLNIVWNELKYNCTVDKNLGDIPELYCIPNQLNQVFLNLLVNAGQAITTPPGKITITTWADEKNIYVSVKDTGCGIPEKNLSKIFEAFFTTKEVGKGTGMGLSLAYDIVRKHGGQIEVKTKIGVGSEFIVNLPKEGYHD